MEPEKRAFDVEFRVEEGGIIRGHAAVFNKLSLPIFDLFQERVLPGAFAEAIGTSDVKALWNHDANIILGRNKSGTLELSEDGVGLKVRITPPEWASGHVESIKRGDVSQMSFGFRVEQENWIHEKGKMSIRELVRVNPLFDVSPVTYPAYPQTDIKVTSRTFLDSIGVSPDIARVLACARRGEALDDAGRQVIERSLSVLNQYLETEPPPAPKKAASERIKTLRLQLDQAEKAVLTSGGTK